MKETIKTRGGIKEIEKEYEKRNKSQGWFLEKRAKLDQL
jgi:hypothetical protein